MKYALELIFLFAWLNGLSAVKISFQVSFKVTVDSEHLIPTVEDMKIVQQSDTHRERTSSSRTMASIETYYSGSNLMQSQQICVTCPPCPSCPSITSTTTPPPCNCQTSTTQSSTTQTTKITLTPSSSTSTNPTTQFVPSSFTELNCIFPFNLNGVWYNKCITVDNTGQYWCSLDQYYNKRLVKCAQQCPLLARQIMANSPGSIHTACIPSSRTAVSLIPNANQIQYIVDNHNSVRSSVQPTSSDMKAIMWDIGLAVLAQQWSENCIFSHDCNSCRRLLNNQTIIVGQNAYGLFGGNYNANTFWQGVMSLWTDEKKNFRYGAGSVTGNFQDIGHYTQIIDSATSRVGCGAAQCGSNMYAYCNYAQGQINVNQPYTSGQPCAQCSPQNCRNNLCYCAKLCQNSGVLNSVACKCACQSGFTGDQCEISLF